MSLSARSIQLLSSSMTDEEKTASLIQLLQKNNKIPDSYIKLLEAEYKPSEDMKNDEEFFDVIPLLKMVAESITEKMSENEKLDVIQNLPKKWKEKCKSLPTTSYIQEYAKLKAELKAYVISHIEVNKHSFWYYWVNLKKPLDDKPDISKPVLSFYEYVLNEFKHEIFFQLNSALDQYSFSQSIRSKGHSSLNSGDNFSVRLSGTTKDKGKEFQDLFNGKLTLTQENDADVYTYKVNKRLTVDINYEFFMRSDISTDELKQYAYHLCQMNHPLLDDLLMKASDCARIRKDECCLQTAARRAEQIAVSIIEYKKELSSWMHGAVLINASSWNSRKLVKTVLDAGHVKIDSPFNKYYYDGVSQTTALDSALEFSSLDVLELFEERSVNFYNKSFLKNAGIFNDKWIALFGRAGMTPYEILMENECGTYYSYDLETGGRGYLKDENIKLYKRIIKESVNKLAANKNKPNDLINALFFSADFHKLDSNLSYKKTLDKLSKFEMNLKKSKSDSSRMLLDKICFSKRLLHIYSEHAKVVRVNKPADAKVDVSSIGYFSRNLNKISCDKPVERVLTLNFR